MKKIFSCLALASLLLPISSYSQAKKDTTIKKSQGSDQGGSVAVAEGSPTKAIQELEAKSDHYKAGPNLSAEDKANNVRIKKEIINGTFDVRELSRVALDKHWSKISAAEQNSFVDLMVQLLEKRAILAKEQTKTQGKAYTVKYLGDTFIEGNKKAKTKTQIYVPKENTKVAIDYKLVKIAAGWKIFDVIVDNASLVDNYKFQFNSIITKNGFPELMSRMRKKLAEMK